MTEVLDWQTRHHAEWTPVEGVDLSWIKRKLMDSDEGEGWDEDYTDTVVEEYRKFLLLTKLNPATPIVPSKAVDKVWHYHILDTQAYVEDCQKVFGKFLHHFPYWGMRGDDDYKDLQDSFARTLQVYEETIGPVPHALWKAAGRCPNCGSGSCFAPGTMVKMADGSSRAIEELRIGDKTAGGAVTGVMQYTCDADELFDYRGTVVTGSHAVWDGETQEWKRVRHSKEAVKMKLGKEDKPAALYCIRCEHHRVYTVAKGSDGVVTFADELEVESAAMNRAVHLISLAELNKTMSKAATLGVAEAAF